MSIRRHPLLAFVILTFGITWGLGACFALFPAQITATFGQASLSNPLFILALYAPSISALVMTAVTGGPRGIGRLLARFLHWRVGFQWYAAVLIGMPVLSALARLLNAAAAGSFPQVAHWYDLFFLGPSGQEVIQVVRQSHDSWLYVVPALITVFVFSDPGPLGEEMGWRGYALPALLKVRSPLAAGLVLGVIWGLWHLPAFFIAGLPQNRFSLPLFLVSIVAFSVLMAWVFKGAKGSLLIAVLSHAMLNLCLDLTTMPLASAMVLVLAAITVVTKDGMMRAPAGGSPTAPTQRRLARMSSVEKSAAAVTASAAP